MVDWEDERHAIMRRNPVGGFNKAELDYGDAVLFACQHAIEHQHEAAARVLQQLGYYDGDLVEDIGKAVLIAPLPDEQRRAVIYGAVKMADAFLWFELGIND